MERYASCIEPLGFFVLDVGLASFNKTRYNKATSPFIVRIPKKRYSTRTRETFAKQALNFIRGAYIT